MALGDPCELISVFSSLLNQDFVCPCVGSSPRGLPPGPPGPSSSTSNAGDGIGIQWVRRRRYTVINKYSSQYSLVLSKSITPASLRVCLLIYSIMQFHSRFPLIIYVFMLLCTQSTHGHIGTVFQYGLTLLMMSILSLPWMLQCFYFPFDIAAQGQYFNKCLVFVAHAALFTDFACWKYNRWPWCCATGLVYLGKSSGPAQLSVDHVFFCDQDTFIRVLRSPGSCGFGKKYCYWA